jgi:hypothetical protein
MENVFKKRLFDLKLQKKTPSVVISKISSEMRQFVSLLENNFPQGSCRPKVATKIDLKTFTLNMIQHFSRYSHFIGKHDIIFTIQSCVSLHPCTLCVSLPDEQKQNLDFKFHLSIPSSGILKKADISGVLRGAREAGKDHVGRGGSSYHRNRRRVAAEAHPGCRFWNSREDRRFIMVEGTGVGKEYKFSGEKLTTLLALYRYEGEFETLHSRLGGGGAGDTE